MCQFFCGTNLCRDRRDPTKDRKKAVFLAFVFNSFLIFEVLGECSHMLSKYPPKLTAPCDYQLYYLFGILYKNTLYTLNNTLNYWFISKNINIKSNFI